MQVLQGLEMTRPQIQTVPVAAFVIVAVEWACSALGLGFATAWAQSLPT